MKTAAAVQPILRNHVLRPAQWDAQAAAWSDLLPHDKPENYAELFKKQIEAGEISFFELIGAEGRKGILLASIDRSYTRPELAIHAAYCTERRQDITAEFMPEIERVARHNQCHSIRFHTMRPGLIVKAERAGFRVVEVVCRKELAP